jgi:hypothetical protein
MATCMKARTKTAAGREWAPANMQTVGRGHTAALLTLLEWSGWSNERLLDPLPIVCTAAGSVYEGEWLSDRMDGYGTLRLANTDTYQGKA